MDFWIKRFQLDPSYLECQKSSLVRFSLLEDLCLGAARSSEAIESNILGILRLAANPKGAASFVAESKGRSQPATIDNVDRRCLYLELKETTMPQRSSNLLKTEE